ncbi:MAG: Rab family GTPase [Candidatus Njordarchaeia archaeon]
MVTRIVKVVMAGDGGVGKTSILEAYRGGNLSKVTMTIGVNLMSIKVDERFSLQIWDLSGQEQYRFLIDVFFRGAKIAILVFDLSRPQTLYNLTKWAQILREGAGPKIPTIVIGNKKDIERKVTQEEIQSRIKELGLPILKYFETSAAKNEGVVEVFDYLKGLFLSLGKKN